MFIVDYSGTRIYNLNMAERIGIEGDEITLYYRGEREVLAKYDPSYPEVNRGVYLLSVIADLQDAINHGERFTNAASTREYAEILRDYQKNPSTKGES